LAPGARGCRPLVIGYHRVVEDFDRAASTDMPTLLVSRAMFERHVEWIGRHFEFVSLDEIGAHIESGEPFSRPVATITFDDGYRDVYEHAVPTLMRVGAAATVFVVTEQIDRSHWQIHDRMYYLLAQAYRKKGDAIRANELFAKVTQAKAEAAEQKARRGGLLRIVRDGAR
jgi:peptidoglycan/xylan/chitin deacetylase (PgdA/CDA1 family)